MQLTKKDLNLIRKVAWSFNKTTALEFDDLFQEAAIGYIQAIRAYNKHKSSMTTYAYRAAINKLKNYSNKELQYKRRFLPTIPQEIAKNFNFLV